MKLSKTICLIAGASALCAQAASAQSLRDFQQTRATDTRASAAITFPLGARARSTESKPRFDFTLATHSVGNSNSVNAMWFDPDFERQTLRAAKLSFTLEQNPRLLFNGQRIATFGPRLTADEEEKTGGGLGTGGKILLGAVALVGASAVFSQMLKDDLEDTFEDAFDGDD